MAKPFFTKGGAKVPHRKNTAPMESVVMPAPKEVILPMQQHIGAPCKGCVNVGDEVFVGTKVGEAGGFVCAPVHSSGSGTVKKIIKVTLPAGNE